jgi:dUTP pyrophosphatase
MSCHKLKLYIKNEELKDQYVKHVISHNKYNEFPNAGFDLFCPEDVIYVDSLFKLDTQVVCSMYKPDGSPCSYYMYPRSSVSKTNLRLANSVGIIDSGYRGNLIGVFDVKDNKINVEKYTRLLQICSPTLDPINVELVSSLEELGLTDRGSGGFGSTGK